MDKIAAIQAWQTMVKAKRWLITTHYNPDGDALASTNIFLELAASINKPALAYCADQPGDNFDFLSKIDQLSNHLTRQQFDSCDIIIVVDCGSASRSKLETWLKEIQPGQTIVEFDHHERQDNYAKISFKENTAAATVEIIYDFLTAIERPINIEMARSILTGLVSDTGNFLYSNTTDKTTKIAAKMMLAGARLPKIISQTLASKNLAVMRLWGRVLSQLKIDQEYLLAIATIRQSDLSELGLTSDDLNGLIGLIGSLQGVSGSLLLTEEDGRIKGSLRTNLPNVDMAMLAGLLGGGGHRKAAGFSWSGSIRQLNGQISV